MSYAKKSVSVLKILIKEILDLIYKRKCINCACQINDGILCKTCSKLVQNLPPFAQGVVNNYPIFSAFYYEGVIKKLIQSLKFKHNKAVSYYLAKFLADYINKIKNNKTNELNLENAIIIPVLTHPVNYNKRGYDNVLLIAKNLAEITGYSLNSTALRKTKYTKPMYKLTRKERLHNIENSFELNVDFNINNPVILLDDITTTGSTLEYLTSLFRKKGVYNLICLTVSKTKKFWKVLNRF